MTPGLVSIITPAYNRIKYIDQVVQSVLEQTYTHIEYIVVDDGSTDGTYERLEQLEKEGKLKLLSHSGRVNKGQAAAVNLGLSQANGEFIGILDSDDWFAANKITDQVKCLQSKPEVGMVFGRTSVVDEDGLELYSLPDFQPNPIESADELLLNCFVVSPGCALMRASIVKEIGGLDETLRAAQDHDLALKVTEKSALAYIDSLCFYYRKHGDTISKNGQERRWLNGYKILENAKARYPYKAATIKARKAVLDFRMAQVRKSQGKYISAILCLIKSAFGDPQRAVRVLSGSEKIN